MKFPASRVLLALVLSLGSLFVVSAVSAGGSKTAICHKDGQSQLYLPDAAISAHIGVHPGDYLGVCNASSPTPEPTTPVTPVPTDPPATVVVTEPPVTVTVEVTEPPQPTVTVEVTQPPATIPATIEVTVTAGV